MASPDLPSHDLGRVVEALEGHGVEYLLIEGVAAVGYGATRQTEDADWVVRRTRANLERMAAALEDLNARLRVAGMTDEDAMALPLRVDSTTLDRAGMTTWMTDAGPFDVLAGLQASDGKLKSYEDLVRRSTLLQGDGFVIRAAALDDIIEAKERADRPRTEKRYPSCGPSETPPRRRTRPDLTPEGALSWAGRESRADGSSWMADLIDGTGREPAWLL